MTVQQARKLAKELVKELTGKANKAKEDAAALLILEADPPTSTWYYPTPWYVSPTITTPADWSIEYTTTTASSDGGTDG